MFYISDLSLLALLAGGLCGLLALLPDSPYLTPAPAQSGPPLPAALPGAVHHGETEGEQEQEGDRPVGGQQVVYWEGGGAVIPTSAAY